jgi:hypothetical protein
MRPVSAAPNVLYQVDLSDLMLFADAAARHIFGGALELKFLQLEFLILFHVLTLVWL